MKFADLSQSDRSNWVMWQVKDHVADVGGRVPYPKKIAFIKSVIIVNIIFNLAMFFKSKWKNTQIIMWISERNSCFY